MSASSPYGPAMEREIWKIYQEFFDLAERRRRWNMRQDIPWDQCNPNTNHAIADVVESFCAVELFLPDYVGQFLPLVRTGRGRAWFGANWGYEESKHSMVMHDWLVRSGHRTEEQIEEVHNWAVIGHWKLPIDDVRGMTCYAMVQELATWLHYRNLRLLVGDTDPALAKLMSLVATDERAHYDFYMKVFRLHLEDDREASVEQLRRVINGFAMPATHLLADSRRRAAAVKSLNIFTEDQFFVDVYQPILAALGVDKKEMRNRTAVRKSVAQP